MRPRLAVLSTLVVTAGCLGGLPSDPSDPGAEAVVEAAVAAGEGVETYRVGNDLTIAGTDDGRQRTLRVTGDGAVDRPARRLRLDVAYDGATRSVYVVENTSYTECASPWRGWGRETRQELDGDWAASDPLGRQLTLLAESPVTWAGNETLRGTAVHVVRAHPSDRTLTQFSEERRAPLDLTGPNLGNATFTAWITEDSSRVLRTRLAFDVHAEGDVVETRMVTTFTDYGATVETSLDPEATEGPWDNGCPGS